MNVSFDQFCYKKKPSVVMIEDSDDCEDDKIDVNSRKCSFSESSTLNPNKRKRAKINSYSDEEEVVCTSQKRICISDDEDDEANKQSSDGVCGIVDVLKDNDDGHDDGGGNEVNNDSFGTTSNDRCTDTNSKIFSFLDSCALDELKIIPNVSKTRAETIFSLKPFENWEDMVQKIDDIRGFSFSKLFESCLTYLEAVDSFEEILIKCKDLLSKNFQQQKFANASNALTHLNIQQPYCIANGLKLKNYQLIGLNWLATLFENNCSGILADEMGLGKTIQTLAFIGYLVEDGHDGPHLIVCPCSTLDNWIREFGKWLPSVQYVVYTGSQEERLYLRNEMKDTQENAVIITTYNMLLSTKQDRKFFKNLKLQYLILDEAHMVKNMKTERYQQLMQLQTSSKLLLTGTPLQNDIIELVSLLTFLMPKLFLEHQDKIKMLLSTHNKNKVSESQLEKCYLENVKSCLNPFILRRLKSDVLSDMPPKIGKLRMCELTEMQTQLYQSKIAEYKDKNDLNCSSASALALMMNLRKIANHPLLLRNIYTDETLSEMAEKYCACPFHSESNVDAVREDMLVMSDFELHSLCKREKILRVYQLDDSKICDCTKLKHLDDLLPSLKRKGSRVLLFSQFVIVLDIVEAYLKIRNYSFLRFDGGVKGELRQSLIDEYNKHDEILIFLLSTKAGGLGINLTSADTVIFYDIDFNPYNDQQAEDRCHRIGQTREVTIYKLIAKDTIEENMLKIGENKLKLGESVIGNNNVADCEEDLNHLISTILQNT